MNRNKTIYKDSIMQICEVLNEIKTSDEIHSFLVEILTETELRTLSKRWCILKLLSEGVTQREIAKELHTSLCKLTRVAFLLKDKNAIVNKILIKEKNNAFREYNS